VKGETAKRGFRLTGPPRSRPARRAGGANASQRGAVGEGGLHPRELDWLALQRGVAFSNSALAAFKMTAEGSRALQRVLAGS
jgi:hypothetical protein